MKYSDTNTIKGFTLIELLVVIAIIAVLSTVVILSLNPAELLRQARDSNRISDLATLKTAISFYSTDVSGNASYSLGDGAKCYVDQISVTGWGVACAGPTGGTARFVAGTTTAFATTAATLRKTDGTGWIPINFGLISSGAPLSALPVDPAPSVSGANNIFYAYRPGASGATSTCTTGSTCTTYEMNARMESAKFRTGGTGDVEGTDGGNDTALFEMGTHSGLSL